MYVFYKSSQRERNARGIKKGGCMPRCNISKWPDRCPSWWHAEAVRSSDPVCFVGGNPGRWRKGAAAE